MSNRNPAYIRSKVSNEFGINHYAGRVYYQAKGFLEKNRDANRPEIVELLVQSQNPIIAAIFSSSSAGSRTFENAPTSPQRRRNFATVTSIYSESLTQLMSIINKCQPHFVRCITPNREKRPDFFDPYCVNDQLRCGGIIDAARVRKAGYPTRIKHQQFLTAYAALKVYFDKLGIS